MKVGILTIDILILTFPFKSGMIGKQAKKFLTHGKKPTENISYDKIFVFFFS